MFGVFVAARAALSVALLGTEVLANWAGSRPSDDAALPLCALYAFAAIVLWLIPSPASEALPGVERLRRRLWLATIGVDLVMFAALQIAAGGGGLGYAALLVLPTLMAGALTQRLQALAVAAAGALVLLAAAWWGLRPGRDVALLITQAGLAGSGLFAVALLSSDLALAAETRRAVRSASSLLDRHVPPTRQHTMRSVRPRVVGGVYHTSRSADSPSMTPR